MTYKTIDKILRDKSIEVSAAEVHGIATGMLCIDAGTSADQWLSELFTDTQLTDDLIAPLTQLFTQLSEKLASDDYSFDLLLPDDDNDLETRVEALRTWCQGFLFGAGAAHAAAETGKDVRALDSTPETREIMQDIVEFTKMAAPGTSSHLEEEIAALTEIHEYLRAAVLLIRDEFITPAHLTYH
ncbi:MAG: YecA family protein [Gammaproteobacteria bacterium HGW-Gammaproteobacteria-3]|jgi:hypothetical protein|nr:MAG: YecA family protein [Gammaproteobacteria bacterium HGW-Gammaproteobacteria-3]